MSAFERLLSFPRFGAPGILERVEMLVAPLKSTPWWQKNPVIKIVGSNGKGSTAHILADRAIKEGVKKVGLYISPHVFVPHERISINHDKITDAAFHNVLEEVIPRIKDPQKTGRFEILTAGALTYFCRQNVDLAVMEVGLGGRLDPVKVAPGRINILTSVDLEHTQILGETLSEIAYEKAQVCKEGDCLVSGVSSDLIPKMKAIEVHSQGHPTVPFIIQNTFLAETALALFLNREIPHQVHDVALTGRFQSVSQEPDIIVDVAHTAQAIEQCLTRLPSGRHVVLMALKSDKNAPAISSVLAKYDHDLTFFFEEETTLLPQVYQDMAPGAAQFPFADLEKILKLKIEQLKKDQVILCVGGFEIVRKIIGLYDVMQEFQDIQI